MPDVAWQGFVRCLGLCLGIAMLALLASIAMPRTAMAGPGAQAGSAPLRVVLAAPTDATPGAAATIHLSVSGPGLLDMDEQTGESCEGGPRPSLWASPSADGFRFAADAAGPMRASSPPDRPPRPV